MALRIPLAFLIAATISLSASAAPKSAPAKKKPAAAEPAPAPKFKTNLGPAALRETDATVPNEAQAAAKRAMADFAKGDLDAAKRGFERVLTLAPGNAATLLNLGLIAHRRQDYAEAERMLKQAARAQPEAGLPWLVLGIVFYEQEKLDAALAALAQAVLYEPKDARAHHYLGVTVGRKGWYLGAEDEMRRALELEPNYAEAHFNLAVFYLQRTPPAVELARRHYHKALDLGSAPDTDVEKRLGEAK